ncbi:MAG: T9SS type A sorting domain-containing protein [Flavobacteriaceae bacterium]|nr:spondin domain-containing protein [Bacteroidia bacterium]NNL60433.1 T9SS type A sorting domain-containing protein [Flavobacteriaceae bacterium]
MKITVNLFSIILFGILISTTLPCKAQSEAIYDITVNTIWTVDQHTSVPGDAHWSNLIGATHNTANEFFSIGTLATLGIKNVAEFGSNTEFTNEINDAIDAIPKRADQKLQDGFSPNEGHEDVAILSDITVSENFSLITLVSMVAPSPDWFIAINSLELRSGNPAINNGWKDDFTMDVFAYDAGTDDGYDYGSSNNASSPFVPVSLITLGVPAPPNQNPIMGNKMATITFNYKSSTLGINDAASIENIKVYPNPTKDILHISNPANKLESVDLYNVLGKRINIITSNSSDSKTLNVRNLRSGVYILKLKNIDGDSSTRKVIIE